MLFTFSPAALLIVTTLVAAVPEIRINAIKITVRGFLPIFKSYITEYRQLRCFPPILDRREIADARALFEDSKKKSTAAKAIIHDELMTYEGAYTFYKELKTELSKHRLKIVILEDIV
jgi:hypothetical protein